MGSPALSLLSPENSYLTGGIIPELFVISYLHQHLGDLSEDIDAGYLSSCTV